MYSRLLTHAVGNMLLKHCTTVGRILFLLSIFLVRASVCQTLNGVRPRHFGS